MLHSSLLQLSIFSFGAMSFACALFAFVLALSVLRHQRLASLHYALYDFKSISHRIEVTPLALFSESVFITAMPRHLEPIAEGWLPSARIASEGEFNILIQPDKAITQPTPRIIDPRTEAIEHPKVG